MNKHILFYGREKKGKNEGIAKDFKKSLKNIINFRTKTPRNLNKYKESILGGTEKEGERERQEMKKA